MPIPIHDVPAGRRLVKERIYKALKDWIIQGQMKPGERLADTEIAEHFHVSRTPVREALQLLETHKFVKVTPGRGTEVTGIDAESFRTWYRTLALLQGFAAELACDHVTDRDIDELEKLNDAYRHALTQDDIDRILRADGVIHERIIALSGYSILAEFSSTLVGNIERVEYIYFHSANARQQSPDSHQRIIEALRAHDREAARRTMQQNWLNSMEVYEGFLKTEKA